MDAPFPGSVFLGMSVDGFIARLDGTLSFLDGADAPDGGGAPDRGGDAPTPDDGEGGDFGFGEFVSSVDALVMGRSTYEFIAPFAEWPYQGRPVHVLSTTLPADADGRITVHRSLEDAVAALAGCRRVYVDGGRTVHAFLRAGLIADLTLSRVPVLIGTGLTPFGELAADIPLEHVGTRSFAGGMVQSTYRVRR
ncbi:dihydrofolate reductase family protein [Blastococcus sp. TML/M2B]|uniref:dihydrofolate reductase family protein n=1 Tax=unclassified Blastococcus TaxID=2619396 RepID=UPI00190D6D88|nr:MULTISPECIES: dihydrofolate reductase family protein [unclassified Blastococcus]MBN1093268.1 dihydrofolate reductase family protein [Blastococcus sp. TML/M2B]MBN1096621.1 dihydrofolate reductase family protein [Blastococcus sp. TML/C7B]